MSLIPADTVLLSDINLYASVQVAVTCAALYDHALALCREVELIWMKPPTLITILYVIERYLGDIALIVGLCLCFSVSNSEEVYVSLISTFYYRLTVDVGIRLFQFRAWGALVYSWATQATMQLRIYAMYRRSRRILILLLGSFLCEIVAIAVIIWRTIGPYSPLRAMNISVSGEHFCSFSGINENFIYLFIPFLCFEFLLFILAARVFTENVRRKKEAAKKNTGFTVNPFMCILARDSLCYFFVNLVACAVVVGLWRGVTALYANMCIPIVMFIEVIVGTRLILDFRERYARASDDDDTVVSDRYSSLHFGDGDVRADSTRISIRCDTETIVVTDVGV